MSRRPPEAVALIARTHWVMSGVILALTLGLYIVLYNSAVLELSRRTYAVTLGLSALYILTGVLVWFGRPIGRPLNYVCSLLYLARPPLGLRIWKIMRSEEYQAHFRRL
jgi:hypothetical protein